MSLTYTGRNEIFFSSAEMDLCIFICVRERERICGCICIHTQQIDWQMLVLYNIYFKGGAYEYIY